MDQLKSMKAFALIVEKESIVAAAKEMGITKAAVSKKLIYLEEHLKNQLFIRQSRKLLLTEIGAQYYKSIKKILLSIDEIDNLIQGDYDQPIGILRIASNRHFGEKYIIENLPEFTKRYPDLKIDLELTDRFPDMEKENIDILCGVEQEGADNYVRKRIFNAQHIYCASPSYLSKFGEPKKLKDLVKHRYITHSSRGSDEFLIANGEAKIPTDFHLRVNDANTMLKFGLQGLGIIKIFNYHIKDAIRDGSLIEILKPYRDVSKPIYIYYPYQKFISKKTRVFLDFLDSVLKLKSNLMT